MARPAEPHTLPADLEDILATNNGDLHALLEKFMPVFCNHVKVDRIFLQPRNPHTRVCKVMRWRRNENIPWYVYSIEFRLSVLITIKSRPAIPGDQEVNQWFIENEWEIDDPLWRSAMEVRRPL